MKVLGIDPSLRSTGYAYLDDAGLYITGVIKCGQLRDMQRLRMVRSKIASLLDKVQPDLVVYEGYAMGQFGGKMFDRAELGGVLKLMIHERRIQILLVPPNNLKLFATGKGNADKDQVRVAMNRLLGRLVSTDDEADAFALFQMGTYLSDRRSRPRDPRHYQHRAISGCELIDGCVD